MTTWKNSGEIKREKLQKERGDKDFAELMPIFVNGAEKPGDIEAARQIDEPGAPRHQHHPAVARCLELGSGHQFRTRRIRRLHQDFVVAGLAEQQESRRRARAAIAGSGIDASRSQLTVRSRALSPKSFAQRKHFWNADQHATKAMTDLLGVGTNAVQVQQRYQGKESRVLRIWLGFHAHAA